MIYVSSTGSAETSISKAVRELAEAGFKNIELSGGTRYETGYLQALIKLRNAYGLSYRLHNYFPPPERSFVLNLASNDAQTLEASRAMVRKAIDLSAEFESPRFGLHAGFRISPKVEELGQTIAGRTVLPFAETLKTFADEFVRLQDYGRSKGVELLLENNVFSNTNKQSFAGVNPFFLTTSQEYFEMKALFEFPLLLDIAHLKVSCRSLGLDFQSELKTLLAETEYIHISDNAGLADSNNEFSSASDFWPVLQAASLSNKTFTIEVYDGLASLQRCEQALQSLFKKEDVGHQGDRV